MATLDELEPTLKPVATDEEKYRRAARRAAVMMRIAKMAMWTGLFGGAVLSLLPLYVMAVMSLKTYGEVSSTTAWALPRSPQWKNYTEVLTNPNAPFFLFFRNTVITSVLPTLGVLLSSSVVAFGFARLNFVGRDRLFTLVLSTMMLPGIVTMVPSYVLYKYLGWVDTFYPFIVPAFFGGGAYNIFLLRQFFKSIPRELDEAALIDGASYATIFWRIVMPNCLPALTTVGVFSFIYNWREFMTPLILLNSPEMQTLEVGLNTYRSLNNEQWHLLMAGSMLVMIPILIIFIAGQKYYVKGIAMTGIK